MWPSLNIRTLMVIRIMMSTFEIEIIVTWFLNHRRLHHLFRYPWMKWAQLRIRLWIASLISWLEKINVYLKLNSVSLDWHSLQCTYIMWKQNEGWCDTLGTTSKFPFWILHHFFSSSSSFFPSWCKTFTENWVGKQSFFVLILTMAYNFS